MIESIQKKEEEKNEAKVEESENIVEKEDKIGENDTKELKKNICKPRSRSDMPKNGGGKLQ